MLFFQFVQDQPVAVEETDDVEVEYVTEGLSPLDPNYRAFAKIFEAFKVQFVSEAIKQWLMVSVCPLSYGPVQESAEHK